MSYEDEIEDQHCTICGCDDPEMLIWIEEVRICTPCRDDGSYDDYMTTPTFEEFDRMLGGADGEEM